MAVAAGTLPQLIHLLAGHRAIAREMIVAALLAMAGFGSGFTWGSALMRW